MSPRDGNDALCDIDELPALEHTEVLEVSRDLIFRYTGERLCNFGAGQTTVSKQIWSNSLFAFMGKDTRVPLNIRIYLIVVPPRPSVVNRSLSTSWGLNLLSGVSRSRTAMTALNFPWVRSRSRCLLVVILNLWSRFKSSTWISLILSLVWT